MGNRHVQQQTPYEPARQQHTDYSRLANTHRQRLTNAAMHVDAVANAIERAPLSHTNVHPDAMTSAADHRLQRNLIALKHTAQ